MSKGIPDRNTRRVGLRHCVAGAVLLLLGCGAPEQGALPYLVTDKLPSLPPNHFSVMTYNVGQYGYADRTGDGQAIEMKPLAEREAVWSIITTHSPDIVALQEIGGPDALKALRRELAKRGADYPFKEQVRQKDSEWDIALLSRYPITAVRHYIEDRYRMGEARVPVKRGFLEAEITIHPDYHFHLFVAQLKSKQYHPLGQTEMRRNEARLLSNHIRETLGRTAGPANVLLVGDLSDHLGSAPLRALTGEGRTQPLLTDLRLADEYGEIWTFFDRDTETYHRHDYMLVSSDMAPHFAAPYARVIRHPQGALASPHRPLLAVFCADNTEPTLPSDEYHAP